MLKQLWAYPPDALLDMPTFIDRFLLLFFIDRLNVILYILVFSSHV